jgi:hypothetical protein
MTDTAERVMRMHYKVTLEGDFAVVHERAQDAVSLLSQRHAARRISDFAAKLPRFSFENKLTDYFDWGRLKVNVTHLVEPGLVRWEK